MCEDTPKERNIIFGLEKIFMYLPESLSFEITWHCCIYMYKIHYMKADCYILCGNVDKYMKENENKLDHYRTAHQPGHLTHLIYAVFFPITI